MLIIKEDDYYGGLKIIDVHTGATYIITAELVYDTDRGHGGGEYVSDVKLKAWRER